ncbi:MAG: hypothetical protein IT172_05810 [Acidobacteria bacterium]|nr:hypothetical protein [Acidobacteriota bacterium]
MNFQVRITCDRELVTYLEIHEAGHKSFYSFPFKGIDYRDTVLASLDFQERLSRFLINYGIYSLFWALYRSKESDLKTRSEAFDRITEKFRKFFGRILKPKRERLIETKEEKGETIKTFELIETGRPTKTEAELDQERQEFKSDVFKALGRLKKENRQLTQYNAAMEIFDGVRNPERKELEKAIGNRLRKFGLTWKQLLKEFNP